jgi:hypothetical protein
VQVDEPGDEPGAHDVDPGVGLGMHCVRSPRIPIVSPRTSIKEVIDLAVNQVCRPREEWSSVLPPVLSLLYRSYRRGRRSRRSLRRGCPNHADYRGNRS